MTYREYIEYIKNKDVGFLGVGRSNMPLIRMLAKENVKMTVRDRKEKSSLGDFAKELCDLGVNMLCGEDYLKDLSCHDVIYKTPAIRGDMKEILSAKEKGSVITSEMELFFNLCPCKIFAVTGSDGKTTTTTLIYEMLKSKGYTCHLGGNIGRPLIGDIEKIKEDDFAVVELSSFQLLDMKKSPDVAVITNLSENHLDWHKDFDEYIKAKENIFNYQNKDCLLVLNDENEYTKAMKKKSHGKVRMFSSKNKTEGAYLENDTIYLDGEEIIKREDIILPGLHNVENYMSAICAVYPLVDKENIKKVSASFGGVEHRMEFVRTVYGVSYYNDSIGSSPARTEATLKAFSDKVVLIAGGYDKNLSYEKLGEIIGKKVKHLVLVGATSDKIEKAVRKCSDVKIERAESFFDAIMLAKEASSEGDKVVLSPASASFDMFRDFEERGRKFKEIVNSL